MENSFVCWRIFNHNNYFSSLNESLSDLWYLFRSCLQRQMLGVGKLQNHFVFFLSEVSDRK